MKALSERELTFGIALTGEAHGNITKAAEIAGCPAKSAPQAGSRMLKRAHVRAFIDARRAKLSAAVDVSNERLLKEMASVAFSDLRQLFREDGSLKPPAEWPDGAAAAVAGLEVQEMAGGAAIGGEPGIQHIAMFTKKLKLWDKIKALEMLAKHKGLLQNDNAPNSRITVNIGFIGHDRQQPDALTIDMPKGMPRLAHLTASRDGD